MGGLLRPNSSARSAGRFAYPAREIDVRRAVGEDPAIAADEYHFPSNLNLSLPNSAARFESLHLRCKIMSGENDRYRTGSGLFLHEMTRIRLMFRSLDENDNKWHAE